MPLTNPQLAVFKTALFAETAPDLVILRNAGATGAIADWYNTPITPEFIVWRTRVTEHEIVGNTSAEVTVWNWSVYIARSQGERDAWVRMFNGTYSVNPSVPQVRSGFADIFSGGTGAAQRIHLLAISKRNCTRAEKLFTVGTGTTPIPANLVFEGNVSEYEVVRALFQ